MPDNLEAWSDFGRHNFQSGWHSSEMLKLYERICFSSKFVGKKLIKVFPKNHRLTKITNLMTKKWTKFDFSNDSEWNELENKGWSILKDLFGENAY